MGAIRTTRRLPAGRSARGAVVMFVVSLIGPVHAAWPASAGPVATTAPAPEVSAALPLVLDLRSDGPGLDPEAVRQAIADELQRSVIPVDGATAPPALAARVVVALSVARGELIVRYDEPGRRPLVRTIPSLPKPEARVRTIAWLVGNLVRDQVSDLLGPPPATATEPAPEVPASPPASQPPVYLALASTPSATVRSTLAPPPPPPDLGYAHVTASLFFPLATNGDRAGIRTRLSLNALYGRVGTLDRGVQVGMANAVDGNVGGGQVGGLFNRAGGDVDGLQIAVGFNVTSGNVRGFQVASGSNRTSGDLDGFQFSAVNSTGGSMRGAQAGLVNTAGDVRGFQVGLVNVGRQVKGVQLGLVNVSDDIEGVPLGLINVSASGGVHPTVWTSGTAQLSLGLKFSTRNVYTLFSAATHEDRGLRHYGPGLAVGLRVPVKPIVLETDLGGTFMFGGPVSGVSRRDGLQDDIGVASWRVLAGFELHRRFTVFVGTALTTRFRFYQDEAHDVSYEVGPDFFAGVQL